jgi:hypothetical protein
MLYQILLLQASYYLSFYYPYSLAQWVMNQVGAAQRCLGGAHKSHKKGIPLRIDLLPEPADECDSQNLALRPQKGGVLLAQLLKQPG